MIESSNPYFLDSNVWLYALLSTPNPSKEDERKYQTADSLIDSPVVVISIQVINEVCANLRKKSNFSENQIQELIQSFYDGCQIVEMSQSTLLLASALRTQHNFSFWDGLIVAAALQSNVKILYSEDMQDGLRVNNQLEIINPFK